MRNNRIEIFFVLYLTALVGFVVVSKERDKHDLRIEQEKNAFLRSFLKPVTLSFPNDTLWWYANIPDGEKSFDASADAYVVDLKIYDIGSTDSVTVKVSSVTHNNLLISPRVAQPLGRLAFGDMADRITRYPVECNFSTVGTYTVTLSVHSMRFHPLQDGGYLYRDITIPKKLIPASVLNNVETTYGSFTVVVEDTSIAKPLDVPNIALDLEKSAIESALGYQETNTLGVNLGFYNPLVRIVEGLGTLERVAKDSKTETYVWTGPVQKYPYNVIVEARVDRRAGGKDITRSQFTVSAQLPYLLEPTPSFAYSGETFVADVRVEGLANVDLYSWELYESAGGGALLSKLTGKGPTIRYHVPNGFAGKQLVVQAKYRGLPYMQFDRTSGVESSSRFVFPVIDPPVHIGLPDQTILYSSGIYRFTAYRYSQPEYRFDQPVMELDDVKVELTMEDGTPIRTNVRMNSPGRFEFAIVYQGEIPYEGIPTKLRITVNDATVSRTLNLRK